MIDDGLFELPVYTCTQEQLVEHVTAYVDRQMADVPDFGTGFWQQQRQEEIQRHLRPVRYNELVGCVEVYSLGTQLRAGLWFTDKKRIVFARFSRCTTTTRTSRRSRYSTTFEIHSSQWSSGRGFSSGDS
jgi:hypothetical protein